MKVKGSILVMLVGALLVPAFAFAADAPAAKAAPVAVSPTPAAPTASMSQMSPAAGACSLLPMLPLSTELLGTCGPCSGTCAGRPELGGCAAGRCILRAPAPPPRLRSATACPSDSLSR